MNTIIYKEWMTDLGWCFVQLIFTFYLALLFIYFSKAIFVFNTEKFADHFKELHLFWVLHLCLFIHSWITKWSFNSPNRILWDYTFFIWRNQACTFSSEKIIKIDGTLHITPFPITEVMQIVEVASYSINYLYSIFRKESLYIMKIV